MDEELCREREPDFNHRPALMRQPGYAEWVARWYHTILELVIRIYQDIETNIYLAVHVAFHTRRGSTALNAARSASRLEHARLYDRIIN